MSCEMKKTEVIDCKGKTVIPGFIDAHCHLAAFAEGLVSIDFHHRKERGLLQICAAKSGPFARIGHLPHG